MTVLLGTYSAHFTIHMGKLRFPRSQQGNAGEEQGWLLAREDHARCVLEPDCAVPGRGGGAPVGVTIPVLTYRRKERGWAEGRVCWESYTSLPSVPTTGQVVELEFSN